MKRLKINFLLLVLSFLPTNGFAQQSRMDFNKLKEFIIANYDDYIISNEFLVKLTEPQVKFLYNNDFCFAHIAYKNYLDDSRMPSSIVVICQKIKNEWVPKRITSFYYKIDLIDSKQWIFLSINKSCNPNGTCDTYNELSYFDRDSFDFEPIKTYSGFDRHLYYYDLFLIDKKDYKKSIGDTLTIDYSLSDFHFNGKGNNWFQLEKRTSVFIGLRDSLLTKKQKSISRVQF